MELIKRYTYAVTQQLPESQRADIDKELNGLIEDMLEDRVQGGEVTQKDVEAVLLELGNPAALADRYRGYQRYLIGPALFPTYINILKIVFGAIGVAMLVLFSVQTILNPPQVLDHFVSTLLTLISAVFQAFAWVTVVFGVIEYYGIQKENIIKEAAGEWTLADLPALPETENRIGRAEPIVNIIFTVLFVALVTFSIRYFGIWVFQEGEATSVIPFLDEAVFRGYLPFIWGVAAVSVAYEAVKLVTRRWTLPLVGFEILTHVLNFALAFFILSNRAVWNPNFMAQMAEAGLVALNSEAYQTVSTMWSQVTGWMIYFVAAIFLIQVVTTAVKAFRMRNPGWKGQASRPPAG